MHSERHDPPRVGQVAVADVLRCDVRDPVGEIVKTMAERGVGAVLVTRNDQLCGIFTERDLLSNAATLGEELFARPIGDLMTADPVCADYDATESEVLAQMREMGIRHFPIQRDGALYGIVSMRDLSRHYAHELEADYEDTRRAFEALRAGASDADGRIAHLERELERHRTMSLTDPTTGLYNKRYFDRRLGEEFARAQRYQQPLSLLFGDIDRFKAINDTHGHQFGDEVLRSVAATLTTAVQQLGVVSKLRKSDIVARYGGEEFVVIAPQTPLEGGIAAAEKARHAVADLEVEQGPVVVDVTISLGVAEADGTVASAAELVQRADSAMYAAKNGGRNRVVAYGVR